MYKNLNYMEKYEILILLACKEQDLIPILTVAINNPQVFMIFNNLMWPFSPKHVAFDIKGLVKLSWN
jgi:hypothetical protein